MKEQCGVKLNNRSLSSLKKILNKWTVIVKDYCDYYDSEDAPYWYGERASISTFAGAIWKSGGLVLEEYRSTKKNRKEKWEGRVDLHFSLNDRGYVVEAKHEWFNLNLQKSTSNIEEEVSIKLRDAVKDVKNSNQYRDTSLGILFAVPVIPKSLIDVSDPLLETFLKGVQMIDYCLLAWQFPKSAKLLEDEKKIYPGVVLIGRVPRRRGPSPK